MIDLNDLYAFVAGFFGGSAFAVTWYAAQTVKRLERSQEK